MKAETQSRWTGIVKRWKASGLTAAEYAVRAGLTRSTLQWWGWRLRHEARQLAVSPPVIEVVTSMSPGGVPRPSTFEVVLADGLRVAVPPDFDAECLRRLLLVLEDR